ncbi:MAG: DUF2934 domain-containing protein [Candidatus Sulfotelmatobacter sp.]
MARAKSTSGKGRNSKAQPDVSTPNGIQDINPGASTELATSGVKPETAIAATKPSDAVLETKSETKMFEVRKTKNVVPINLEDEIRRRAYELYQQRHPGAGSEVDDWFAAEREVMQRYHLQSA